MSEVQSLQIGMIFLVIVSSVAGFVVPYYRGVPKSHGAAQESYWLALQLFSAGVMFSGE